MKSQSSANPAAIRSRNQIIQALLDLMKDVPYQEITIKEIAFKANVVRRTFYRHFASKEAVISSYLDDLFASYIRKILAFEKPDTYSIAKAFFEIALQHKDTFFLLRQNHLSIPVNQLESYHRELNKALSIRYDQIDLSNKFHAYATSYFAGGLLNVLNKWIDDGMNLPPEELGEIFVFLSPKGAPSLLSIESSKQQISKPDRAVINWLLDSDPSIRWQVLCDLTDAPAHAVAAERAKVATEGWGAQLLSLQAGDGRWGNAAWNRGWDSTMHVLMLLRDLGLDPTSDEARRAVSLVRDQVTWQGCGPPECDRNSFFEGEIEPCINGQVGAVGAYFGQDIQGLIEQLLTEQLPDGGWNCEALNGSTRSSFNTTICVLEALLEYEQTGGAIPEITEARLRGQEYLLERRLFRRRSTGEVIERDRKGGTAWTHFAFPTWWHYDVLRGLEYLRKAGVQPDERVAEAIDLVFSKRTEDGRWLLETRYPGVMPVEIDEGVGRPSRWNTLRALRVLDWYVDRS